jgi:hypothetical protein
MWNSKTQSAGGKARGDLQRKEAIDNYYLSPNICEHCNSIINVSEDEKVADVKKKKFCNHSCAAKFNNKSKKKIRIKLPSKRKSIDLETKANLYSKRKNWQSANSSIRNHARKIYFNSNLLKQCKECGYNKHVEICHIKQVKDFADEATILEINNLTNLVALCPTHHWEFDNLKKD